MDGIKTLAMYLPQFHVTEENSRWWGDGFTDWVAVKNAERYFDGHYQPREPLDGIYYDLSNREAMERQCSLIHEYDLDGLCFYHYYFKDGRKVLERPAENLLSWKELEIPFCFCWANESWVRTWSRMNNNRNIWADKYETKNDGENETSGVLLKQEYGREQAWKAHFEYLLPFFQDSRYIRREGSPVFLIYRPDDIACLAEMCYYWKLLAVKEGIKGLYIIGMNTWRKCEGLDAVLINGPGMYSWASYKRGWGIEPEWRYGIQSYQYEDVWKNAVKEAPVSGCRTYFGAFTDFDDTPRRGKSGCFLSGVSLELFEKYICLIMRKNRNAGNEYLFINAFNEWGEGMYLEPDKRNGCGYLEILQKVKDKVNGETVQRELPEEVSAIRSSLEEDKDKCFLALYDKWMTRKEQQRPLSGYLKKYQYHTVAVYGLGALGRHLVRELVDAGIEVKYIIDRNTQLEFPGIRIFRLRHGLEKVDAIIVTAVCAFEEIWQNIRRSGMTCSIVSLAEMIREDG